MKLDKILKIKRKLDLKDEKKRKRWPLLGQPM